MADELVLYQSDVARPDCALDAQGDRAALSDGSCHLCVDDAVAHIAPSIPWARCRHYATAIVVTETAAICAYLADAFPQASLAPRSGSKLQASPLPLAVLRGGTVRSGGVQQSDGIRSAAGSRTVRVTAISLRFSMRWKRRYRAADYLVGDSFTAADLYVGSHVGFGLQFGTWKSVRLSRNIGSASAAGRLACGRRNLTMPKPRS